MSEQALEAAQQEAMDPFRIACDIVRSAPPLTPRKNTALYEIADEIAGFEAILDQLVALDDLEAYAALRAEIDRLGLTFEDKLERCARLIYNLSAEAEMVAAEANRLIVRGKSIARRVESMRSYVLSCLLAADRTNVLAGHFRLRAQRNGGALPMLIDEDKVPSNYFVARTITELDRKMVRAELEGGTTVPGAVLAQRGYHLKID